MTGHWTAGHRTAGRPDPDMGAEWADTGWWTRTATDGMAGVLAFPAAATTPDRWGAVRKLRRPDATWSTATRTAQQKGHCQEGLATAVTRQGQGDTSPSSWRLGALLSCVGVGGYEERAMGRRKGEVCGGQAGEKVLMGVIARC